ncbi:hypothetical protein GCM10009020_26870 [Natronoarchaeum mannanilyticum]|uniref:Uncharacterized protein n=2 Tax=Natronoarchaeum mannanilyticum TaxID=926360 RepID=A0AAV3TBG3_9EURY
MGISRSSEDHTGTALVSVLLSTLVLLTNEILYRLSLLADADPGIINEIAAVIGWVALVASAAYLLVGLRTYLPIRDFTDGQ